MKPSRRQSGDTLVEVVMSLAILAVTLVSAFDISNRSYSEGLQSREHTQATYLAQQQADMLYGFRDHVIAQAVATGTPAAPPASGAIQSTPATFGYCASAAGCHLDPANPLTPVSGPAPTVTFNGITYHVVIEPLVTTPPVPAINATNDQGSFTVMVSWSSSVGTGATGGAATGDTGTNENTTSLNVILVDNRGITPRDCSVVGSSACS